MSRFSLWCFALVWPASASHPGALTDDLFLLQASADLQRSTRRACVPPSDPVHVFSPGDGGVDCFRIPAVVLTAQGSLLAFAEARRGGCSDDAAHELAVRRSTDHGQTWSSVSFVAGGPEHLVGNPYPIAMSSGGVALLYVKRRVGEPDLGGGNGIVFSEDDGLTWSAERDVSAGFGAAAGSLPGPGAGVELSNKRLLVVSHHGAYQKDYVTFSDDGGKTWETLNQSLPGMDEGTLADLGGDVVVLNMRHLEEGKKGRAVARSFDGGMTWGNVTFDEALVGPICQGSLAAFSGSLFFSNPASSNQRANLTVKRSDDGGRTWSSGFVIQEHISAGYSSLVRGPVGDPRRGGILYESSQAGDVDFRTFPLALEAGVRGCSTLLLSQRPAVDMAAI